MAPRKPVFRRVKSPFGSHIVRYKGPESSMALSYDFNITDEQLAEYKKHLTNTLVLEGNKEKETILRTYEIAGKLINELEELRGVINNTAPVIEKLVGQIAELRDSLKDE